MILAEICMLLPETSIELESDSWPTEPPSYPKACFARGGFLGASGLCGRYTGAAPCSGSLGVSAMIMSAIAAYWPEFVSETVVKLWLS